MQSHLRVHRKQRGPNETREKHTRIVACACNRCTRTVHTIHVQWLAHHRTPCACCCSMSQSQPACDGKHLITASHRATHSVMLFIRSTRLHITEAVNQTHLGMNCTSHTLLTSRTVAVHGIVSSRPMNRTHCSRDDPIDTYCGALVAIRGMPSKHIERRLFGCLKPHCRWTRSA